MTQDHHHTMHLAIWLHMTGLLSSISYIITFLSLRPETIRHTGGRADERRGVEKLARRTLFM